jgi:hypothetical protein
MNRRDLLKTAALVPFFGLLSASHAEKADTIDKMADEVARQLRFVFPGRSQLITDLGGAYSCGVCMPRQLATADACEKEASKLVTCILKSDVYISRDTCRLAKPSVGERVNSRHGLHLYYKPFTCKTNGVTEYLYGFTLFIPKP